MRRYAMHGVAPHPEGWMMPRRRSDRFDRDKPDQGKRPFDIHLALSRARDAVMRYPKAAMFELADEGFRSPFEQVVACIISVRTREETTLTCARRLFALARTPVEMSALTPEVIDQAIVTSTFHDAKTVQILDIARRAAADFAGELPCDSEVLQGLRGIGPKCASLALGIACGQPRIAVDIHVHRVTNRWGYIQARTPEQTMIALEAVLPRDHWVEINRLLVPFGKHICTGELPRCSICPVLDMCRQVGVTSHR
jgi:endonuclease-3